MYRFSLSPVTSGFLRSQAVLIAHGTTGPAKCKAGRRIFSTHVPPTPRPPAATQSQLVVAKLPLVTNSDEATPQEAAIQPNTRDTLNQDTLTQEHNSFPSDPQVTAAERENADPTIDIPRKTPPREGKHIVFTPFKCPKGYVLVTGRNEFITERCRNLSLRRYAVYSPGEPDKPPTYVGLCVVKEALETAEAEFRRKRDKLEGRIQRYLDEEYPHLPPDDKAEIIRTTLTKFRQITSGSAGINRAEQMLQQLVRQRHTWWGHVRGLSRKNMEVRRKVKEKVREVMDSYRAKRK